MRWTYAVTFEFAERAPVTHRGEVQAGSAAVCVQQATKEAAKQLKPLQWTSMVCVLLEELEEAKKARRVLTPAQQAALDKMRAGLAAKSSGRSNPPRAARSESTELAPPVGEGTPDE